MAELERWPSESEQDFEVRKGVARQNFLEDDISFPDFSAIEDPRELPAEHRLIAEVVLRTVEVEARRGEQPGDTDKPDRVYLGSKVIRDTGETHPDIHWKHVQAMAHGLEKGGFLTFENSYQTRLSESGRQLLSDLRDQFLGPVGEKSD